jgi:hypothetical protein
MVVNLPATEPADTDTADAIEIADQAIVHRLRRHPTTTEDTP